MMFLFGRTSTSFYSQTKSVYLTDMVKAEKESHAKREAKLDDLREVMREASPKEHFNNDIRVTYLSDKGNGLVNEDSFLITSKLFGIFDGATGLTKYIDSYGNTGGLLASRIAKNVFENKQDEPLLNSLEEIIRQLRHEMHAANVNPKDKKTAWTTSASVVRLTDDSVEYIQLGDSPIVFGSRDGSLQSIVTNHDLDTLRLWKKLAHEGVKDVRHDKKMEEQLVKTRLESNVTHGILNGEPEALGFVVHGSVPRMSMKTIFIFSDGMLIPKKNPEEADDFHNIVHLFRESGLEKIKNYVREVEDSDPSCLNFPRFKQHDDLTAIAISL